MKIVIAEKISSSAVKMLRQEPGWRVVTHDQVEPGRLAEHVADADALIVRSAVHADAALLDRARRLRVIGRAGVGVDNVDLDAATKRGICVMNTPGANAVAVAEHTIGLMLAMARSIPRADSSLRQGRWDKKSLEGTELRNKTLGIFGLGRIGMEVARRAQAFGMTVMAHDPYVTPAVAAEKGIAIVTADELYAATDYITLHVGLTPQTAGMINSASIAKMKEGVRLVNCARGELVDEAALADALQSEHVAGAAIDVFQEEPPTHSPLLALPNAILTPHIAGSTKEAQEAIGVQIAQQVKEYLKKGVLQNAVNVPSVTGEEYAEMLPYIGLAEKLGSFVAQAVDGNLEEISLHYGGRISQWKTDLVRNAAIMGVLCEAYEHANLVNAAGIAKERGIRITESAKKPELGEADILTIHLRTSAGEEQVRGTVLHHNSPRLLAIGNIDIEARLERDLLYMHNLDVPGVVGKMGTILANANINIADLSLGRTGENGNGPRMAISVVRVDSPVPESVLAELRRISAVTLAKAIHLPGETVERTLAAAD
jgi:D-3-phosphoglycerate dehydrogenase / 2-oxoglutarate reductase